MRALSLSLAAFGGSLLLVSAAGCGTGGSGEGAAAPPPSPAVEEFAKLDSCKILTSDDVAALKLDGPGSPESDIASEPGCYYDGDAMSVVAYKNTKDTVDSSQKSSNWAQFNRVDVNGRSGATGIAQGSTQSGICSAMFNSGDHMVRIAVSDKGMNSVNKCDEALKIAKQVEPRMPKPA